MSGGTHERSGPEHRAPAAPTDASGGTPEDLPVPRGLVVLDIVLKTVLLWLVVRTAIDPSWGNLEGKAPMFRAITYPMLAAVLPAIWVVRSWRGLPERPFPWLADVLVTATCFNDFLGNRLDLYDAVTWFDDAVHFLVNAALAAAVVLLWCTPATRLRDVLARAVAVTTSLALAWEIWEYRAFIDRIGERFSAHADTLGDLGLGWAGAVVGALLVVTTWRRQEQLAGLGPAEPEHRAG
ncbi:unannotated protein [freshwater metagenome]|uniref:Unannotated protein n=1 Tax=freshwater metagenome TaxID=449393 RepID=A0A6J6UNK4_9ZZZZ|nr:hypothetical protein [Actinomycetota bacterium]